MDKIKLSEIIKNNKTYKDCLVELGIRPVGSNYVTIKKYIKLYDIDISHFDQYHKNFTPTNKIPLDKILVVNSNYSRTDLKKRLYKLELLKPICSMCGQDENWNGMKISLILDHINGVYNDNRLENLRIVCPNCNAGLDTFSGRNNKKDKLSVNITNNKYICKCGNIKHKTSLTCNKCKGTKSRKVERPSIEQLLEEINELGYSATGRKYGVSHNAIRKWIKNN